MAPDHSKGKEAASPVGRPELAISEFQRLIRERPGDLAAAETLASKLVIAADGAARAGHCAEALAYLETVAKWRETRGDQSRALELRKTMQRLELEYLESQLGFGHAADTAGPAGDSRSPLPSRSSSAATRDIRVQARQALTCVKRGDAVGAAKYLTEEMAEGNPRLLLAIAEIQLRGGKLDRGIALAERAIARDLSVGDDAVRVGLELAGRQPDAGFLIVEMVADAWAAQSKWPQAMAAFEKFILLKPDYVPAMVRLREMETAESDEASGKRVVPFRRISPTPKFRSA